MFWPWPFHAVKVTLSMPCSGFQTGFKVQQKSNTAQLFHHSYSSLTGDALFPPVFAALPFPDSSGHFDPTAGPTKVNLVKTDTKASTDLHCFMFSLYISQETSPSPD